MPNQSDKITSDKSWAIIMSGDIVDGGHLAEMGASALSVWLCLLRFAGGHGEAFPSYSTLVRLTGMSQTTVAKAIKTLSEKGYITRTVDGRPARKPSHYRIASTSDELAALRPTTPGSGVVSPSFSVTTPNSGVGLLQILGMTTPDSGVVSPSFSVTTPNSGVDYSKFWCRTTPESGEEVISNKQYPLSNIHTRARARASEDRVGDFLGDGAEQPLHTSAAPSPAQSDRVPHSESWGPTPPPPPVENRDNNQPDLPDDPMGAHFRSRGRCNRDGTPYEPYQDAETGKPLEEFIPTIQAYLDRTPSFQQQRTKSTRGEAIGWLSKAADIRWSGGAARREQARALWEDHAAAAAGQSTTLAPAYELHIPERFRHA